MKKNAKKNWKFKNVLLRDISITRITIRFQPLLIPKNTVPAHYFSL